MLDGTEDWCKIWRKTGLCFPKWQEQFGKFLHGGKERFNFRKEMVELNENRNSLQLDRPDAVRKLYFTLEINE